LQGSFIVQSQGYPTLNLLRLCFFFNLLQLSATFVGQIGILINRHGAQDSTFFAVLVLNIVFSATKLLLSVLEISLKVNILAGHAGRHGRSNSSLGRASQWGQVNPIVQTNARRLTLASSAQPPRSSEEVLEMTVQSPLPFVDAPPTDDIPKSVPPL
jgi:hypothetical protein